jgi:MraZ protein
VEIDVLMGHAPAKVDEKGRIKIPTNFRRTIEERYGLDCFITSFDGESAEIYPLPVWQEFLGKLSRVPSTSKARTKYLQRANYYGHIGTLDAQGRLLVPANLRGALADDVVVLGSNDHLTVWNEERIQKLFNDSPLTDDDMKELELHGV